MSKLTKVAAFGLAAASALAPMAALAADTDVKTQTDTLKITIESVCSFGHKYPADSGSVINVAAASHAAGGTTYTGTWGEGATKDQLSATFVPGVKEEALGTTTLKVYCNNAKGYTITTSGADALEGAASGDEIAIGDPSSTAASAWSFKLAAAEGEDQRGSVATGHTTWATSSNANEVVAQLANKTTANAGDTYTVTYGVSIDEEQPADVYTGSITYTLAEITGA